MLSAFNAVSLSPALAAKLLRPKPKGAPRGPLQKFYAWFNKRFDKTRDRYADLTDQLICRSAFVLVFLVVVTVVTLLLGSRMPSGFLPQEDQGYIYAVAQLPYASSLARTDAVCKKVEDIVRKTPGIEYCTTVEGFSLLSQLQATYNAFFFITFKPWGERTKASEQFDAIRAHLNTEFGKLPEANVIAFPPPDIPGVGTAGGITMMLEDRSGRSDFSFLTQNVNQFMDAIRKRPELSGVNTTYLPEVPLVFFDVDRDKVLKQGVAISDVYRTLQTFMGGYFVNYFNRFGRQWQVYIEAESEDRASPENVGRFYVRNSKGENVPLSTLITVKSQLGPEFTQRFNEYRSAQINGSAAPGYSADQASAALEEVFKQTMPREMGFDYSGISFLEQKARQGVPPAAIFGLSLLFVFLILAALYESWSLPFSVLLSTPVAVFGAFFLLWLRRTLLGVFLPPYMVQIETDVYSQIGLVMLIGLAAKNAILIVEFAKDQYEQGKALADAALEGAKLRLRPILMTSCAFILGCVPLWTATGAGSVARQIMGTAVIGGMLAASAIGIFFVPGIFYTVEKWAKAGKEPASGILPAAPSPAPGD